MVNWLYWVKFIAVFVKWLYRTVQYVAVQYRTVQYGAVQYKTVAVRCYFNASSSTMQCGGI